MRKKDETKHSLYIKPIAMLIIAIIGILLTALIFYLTYISFTTTKGTIHSDNIASPPGLAKGDWLSFWGCIFSALCTIVLACFALVQNVNLSKINDRKEKTDVFFAELRFSAEFFSQVEFENIYLKREGVEACALEFEMRNNGNYPPSNINMKQFSICRRILEPIQSSVEETEVELYHIKPTTEGIPLRKPMVKDKLSSQLFSINIPTKANEISEFILQNDRQMNRINDLQNKESIIAKIEYTLTNPLEVETAFVGELSLKYQSSWHNPKHEIGFQDELKFNVVDALIETLVYKYVGNPL